MMVEYTIKHQFNQKMKILSHIIVKIEENSSIKRKVFFARV